MFEEVRIVNEFFRYATRQEVDGVKSSIILSKRQECIFSTYYIERHDVNFIADSLFCSPQSIHKELKTIRRKLMKALQL